MLLVKHTSRTFLSRFAAHRWIQNVPPGRSTTKMEKEKDYTLVFCRRTEEGIPQILLGMKKRGFGAGKWNGFGGKIEEGETVEHAALRELEEESSLQARSLNRRGYLVFRMIHLSTLMRVHVFDTWEFDGTPTESEEMRPQWYNETEVPFERMWPDDEYWFNMLLTGKSFVGSFTFEDDETIVDHSLRET